MIQCKFRGGDIMNGYVLKLNDLTVKVLGVEERNYECLRNQLTLNN